MTIKTQLVGDERRIITKAINGQRRVSCSCCETECCMYPADQLGAGYTIDDLPDLLVTQFVGEQFEKRDTPLTYTVGDFSFTAYFGGEGFAIGIRSDNPNLWVLQVDFGFTLSQKCLFSQLIQDGPPDWVYDNFEDTYTVEKRTETLTGPPEATFTITRESLCRWCGFDPLLESTVCLEYVSPNENTPPSSMWFFEGFGEISPKNNRSPVGNYNDGGSIWMVLEP